MMDRQRRGVDGLDLFRSVRAGAGRSAEPAWKAPLLRQHLALLASAPLMSREIFAEKASGTARFVLCDRPVLRCAAFVPMSVPSPAA